MKKRYFGDKEIVSEKVIQDKTPMDNDIVSVVFKDKTSLKITKAALDRIVTDSPLEDDPSKGSVLAQIRTRKINPIVQQIIALMTEGGLNIDEIDPVIETVVRSINWNTEEAANRLWQVSHAGERTLLSTDSIIKGNGPKEY